jgi:serine/threonine-protein kinase
MHDLSGRKLGQYELQARMGRGGMADVYKAYQPGMDRYVAVKVMLGHLASDEDFVERFRREARAVGKLRHPNIVQVFDFGVEDDIYYMAMEFIEGGHLKRYITMHQNVDPETALFITSQLADALEYAHRQGMVHRDIKPANVMFVEAERNHVVLTDFGIARILGQSGITASGALVGTPAYMSPEAARGDDTDERADLYGLGVILFELLTGTVPYDADTPMAIAMKHINAPVPTPESPIHAIPEIVVELSHKALAKQPDERFQSATVMKLAIDEAWYTLRGVQNPTELASATRGITQAVPIDVLDGDTQPTPVYEPSRSMLPLVLVIFGILLMIVAAGVFLVLGGDDEPDEPLIDLETPTPTRVSTTVTVIPTQTAPPATEALAAVVTLAPTFTLASETPSNTPSATLRPIVTATSGANPTQPGQTPTPTPSNTVPVQSPVAGSLQPIVTSISAPPTVAGPPTVLYPNGRRLLLYYDESSLYMLNASGESVRLAPFAFERLDNFGAAIHRFEGQQWAEFNSTISNGWCTRMEIFQREPYLRAPQCNGRFNSSITPTGSDPFVFWTTYPDSTNFRVLWDDQEIARCEIGAAFCEFFLP